MSLSSDVWRCLTCLVSQLSDLLQATCLHCSVHKNTQNGKVEVASTVYKIKSIQAEDSKYSKQTDHVQQATLLCLSASSRKTGKQPVSVYLLLLHSELAWGHSSDMLGLVLS